MAICPTKAIHIHGIKTKLHREHVRKFCAYLGALLMLLDYLYTQFGPAILHHIAHAYEPTVAVCGKCGAAMAGISVFFEKATRVVSAITD